MNNQPESMRWYEWLALGGILFWSIYGLLRLIIDIDVLHKNYPEIDRDWDVHVIVILLGVFGLPYILRLSLKYLDSKNR